MRRDVYDEKTGTWSTSEVAETDAKAWTTEYWMEFWYPGQITIGGSTSHFASLAFAVAPEVTCVRVQQDAQGHVTVKLHSDKKGELPVGIAALCRVDDAVQDARPLGVRVDVVPDRRHP
jgi:hypothetical protein